MQVFFQKKPDFTVFSAVSPACLSEPEIPSAVFYLRKILPAYLSCLFPGNILKFTFDHPDPLFFRFRTGVILQIFFQRHQRVWMTAVRDLSGFHQRHEAVAGTALTVAGGTETGNITQIQKPAYHLVKSSPVAYVKLGGILVHGFLFHISSYRSPGTSADLGNAQIQDFLPALLGFPGRYDHSRVGNGNADHSYD